MAIVPAIILILLCPLVISSGEILSNSVIAPIDFNFFHIDDNLFWIYTAYWDLRIRNGILSPSKIGPPPYVRILAVGSYGGEFYTNLKESKCEFYYESLHQPPIQTSVLGNCFFYA